MTFTCEQCKAICEAGKLLRIRMPDGHTEDVKVCLQCMEDHFTPIHEPKVKS